MDFTWNLIKNWSNLIKPVGLIKNDVKSPNVIYNGDILDSIKSQPGVSLTNPKSLVNIDKYLTGTSITNEFDFVDTYPITDFNWNKKNIINYLKKLRLILLVAVKL